MSMHSNAGGCLKFFAIDRGEHSDVVVRSASGCDESVILIDHLYEVSNDEGYSLNTFKLFLRS